MVEETVRDAGFLGDVADAGGVEAFPCEDAHRRVEEEPTFVGRD
jgi:hypothetical protein